MTSISNISLNPDFLTQIKPSASDTEKAVGTFGDLLNSMIEQTNQTDAESKQASLDLLAGEVDDLHTVLLTAERAEIALQLTLQIRNRVLDAYNEVMRMQV